MYLSFVSPVYRGGKLVEKLVSRIEEEALKITQDFEIILVEDFSPDDSWQKMLEVAKSNPRVKAVKLSRNFGQQYALAAGLSLAQGEWICTLDCDLQDDPAEMLKMHAYALQTGCDGVLASRTERKDDWLKRNGSKAFYSLLSYLTSTDIDPTIANFYLCKRKVFESVMSMGDYYRYLPVMIKWVGFDIRTLEIQHAAREDGIKSSYNLRKRFRLAYETIISFSEKPLRLMISTGIAIAGMSFLAGFILVIQYLSGNYRTPGWASVFLALSIYSGIIITVLGLVGVYVGKTFETVKRRPNFIIDRIYQAGHDA